MQRVYTSSQNTNKNVFVINTIKFIIRSFKRYTYRIDSVKLKDEHYLVTFFYVARRQPFTKPVEEIFKNRPLLKMFKPSEVALISYLYTRAKYENMIKNNIINKTGE